MAARQRWYRWLLEMTFDRYVIFEFRKFAASDEDALPLHASLGAIQPALVLLRNRES